MDNTVSSVTDGSKDPDGSAYCLDLVRQWDHDRLLTALFVPQATQKHWLALMAFNVELSMIRDAVTESMLGHIRFQWWYDQLHAIKDVGEQTPGHPVLAAMKEVFATGRVAAADLEPMIAARDKSDLQTVPFFSMTDLIAYLGDTAGYLQLLQAQVLLEGPIEPEMSQAVQLVGKALGLMGIVRSMDFNASHQRCLIPLEEIHRNGVTEGQFLQNPFDPAFEGIYRSMISEAQAMLNEARTLYEKRPWGSFPVFLAGVLAQKYAVRLQKAHGNLLYMKPYTPLKKQLHLTQARLSRKF